MDTLFYYAQNNQKNGYAIKKGIKVLGTLEIFLTLERRNLMKVRMTYEYLSNSVYTVHIRHNRALIKTIAVISSLHVELYNMIIKEE